MNYSTVSLLEQPTVPTRQSREGGNLSNQLENCTVQFSSISPKLYMLIKKLKGVHDETTLQIRYHSRLQYSAKYWGNQ